MSQARREAFIVGRGGSIPRAQAMAAKMAGDQAARRALSFKNYRSKPPAPAVVAANAGFLRNRGSIGMRVEKKVVDVKQGTYAVENTGTQLLLLNGCIAGSQNYNRIGRKINLKSLQIHGDFINHDTTTIAVKARMLIVFDKQSNGAAPGFADIITSQDITGATSSTVNDMVNLNNRDRFEIIRDTFVTLGPIDTTATQSYASAPLIQSVDTYIKLGNRETVYNAGTAGTVGDIQSGALYVFWISNTTNATGCDFVGSFRLRFTDM